ncbi:MAG TPA: hypothetical protein P5560_06240 [Thermotogota bacterium]|nr:hypothetical protein [Thermotogota bacterium]HRW92539.1 hypothetical protein [Thermotogota bacterium]
MKPSFREQLLGRFLPAISFCVLLFPVLAWDLYFDDWFSFFPGLVVLGIAWMGPRIPAFTIGWLATAAFFWTFLNWFPAWLAPIWFGICYVLFLFLCFFPLRWLVFPLFLGGVQLGTSLFLQQRWAWSQVAPVVLVSLIFWGGIWIGKERTD